MAVEINGYSNPNRSDHLNAALNAFKNNPQKTWEGQHPVFYQTAQKMHSVGKVLLGLSGALAIISIIVPLTSFTLLNNQLIVGGILGGSALVSGILGTVVLSKSYRKDPAYLQKIREEMLDCLIVQGFDGAKKNYGEFNVRYQLLSQDEITYIMNTHYQMDQKTYFELTHHTQNSGYVTADMKNRAFLKDIEEKNFSYIINDKNYDAKLFIENKIAIQQKLLAEIGNLHFHEIFRDYSFAQLEEMELLAGVKDRIGEKFIEETERMSWEEIFITYNINQEFWNLCKFGIVKGLNLREKVESEFKSNGLVYMLRKYGSGLFKHSVLDPLLLKISDFREIFAQITFVDFFNNFCVGLPLPSKWNPQAIQLAQEYKNATTRHLERIPGKEYDADGQGVYELVAPQDSETLAKTIADINQRWTEFLSHRDI